MSDEFFTKVPPPEFEVDRHTKIDLFEPNEHLDRSKGSKRFLALLSRVLESGGVELALEQLFENAEEHSLSKVLEDLSKQTIPERNGYLIRINYSMGEVPGPGANFIEPVGPGLEPLDALAESYRNPGLKPPSGELKRRYLWCTKVGERLKFSCLDVAIAEYLEAEARIERDRREALGWKHVTVGDFEMRQLEMAEQWTEYAEARTLDIAKTKARIRIADLNRQFQRSQGAFNKAFVSYQVAQIKMAEYQREAQFLNSVSTAISLVNTGLQLSSSIQSQSAETNESLLRWNESRTQILNDASKTYRDAFEVELERLRSIDQTLRDEWRDLKFENHPDAKPINTIILG